MMSALFNEYPAAISLVMGLILIFWPPPKRLEVEAERQARLAELASGAPERFLEERRSLEAYGPGHAGPYRLWGIILLALGIALLFL
ncbi:hypothetical protein ACFOMD_11580 [Sphingoaurantiacus capsulatus]|uniref:Uncharacterized protein n=1 Tax=Sphingoaurantiacus capsulatus TaxID=1771310 RepID=A0ABV7XD92_9SPHN